MDNINPLITIIIPCYEMCGMGAEFLQFSFERISNQTYKNINVLVSDQSENTVILKKVQQWSDRLNIEYIYNNKIQKRSSSNLNYALSKVNKDSKYVKFLFQDDFLFDEKAIQLTVEEFEKNPDKKWLVSSCCHSKTGKDTYYFLEPSYYDKIYLGEPNTISSPSVLTIKNNLNVLFDEKLFWLMDVEYYKRLHNNFGDPVILKQTTVVNRTWEGQVSNVVSGDVKEKETKYVIEKMRNTFN